MKIDNTPIGINRIITTGKMVSVPENKVKSSSFKEIFQDVLNHVQDIKFSKHAAMRMEERNISLSPFELKKMKEAIDKAHEKGIKDSLVLMKNAAFVVNIPSRTVITAVDDENLKENIFTNIDGAVIL
jgi:flagellar operon protein